MMVKNGYLISAVAMLVLAPAAQAQGVRQHTDTGLATAWRSPVPTVAEWYPQDDADSLYRAARNQLRERNYERSADMFRSLRTQYPNSSYVAQSMYWEAFALNRIGDDNALRRALTVLQQQSERFPDEVSSDARALYVQVQGKLARQGDADAAAAIAEQAAVLQTEQSAQQAAQHAQQAAEQAALAGRQFQQQSEEDDVKMQALSALMQMDPDLAMPTLRRVLENRSEDNTEMRRRAVFIVAQKRGVDREQILIDVARNDPDAEVRSSAVFHLSQVNTPEAVAALDSILQASNDRDLQQRAIFALSQHRSARAGEILRNYARRGDAPVELRAAAIQWLGQRRDNSSFLRDLYQDLTEPDLKEKALFALSQTRDEGNASFLLSIATNESESIDLRKRALFWLGNMRGVELTQLYSMYDRTTDREMKEQLIFVYSQRRNEDAAIEKLIDIVRTESDTQLKSRAIFWLGQTRDPRAVAVLEEIINR